MRQLVSSPSDYPRAFICNECVEACSFVLEEKDDPYSGNPYASEFFALVEQWVMREAEGHDASDELGRMRAMARQMFALSEPIS